MVAAMASAVSPPPAAAKATTAKAIWGPQQQNGKPQWPIYSKLGVGIFQIQLRWEQVAASRPADPRDPGDPAYHWPEAIDSAIKGGSPYGIQVLLMVQGAPAWANGGKAWNYPPSDPDAYTDFITAAAKRYPEVSRWMIWGEPNGYVTGHGGATGNFMPIEPDDGKPLPRSKQAGPRLYARYLDAAYGALKARSRRNQVIGGNTWTAGAVRPLHWIEALKLPNGRPPRMDLYGHNPIGFRKPDLRNGPQATGTADFSDLDTLGQAVDRHLGRRPEGGRINIFISEYVVLTEHPIDGISYYFTPKQQASFIAAGLRIVRRSSRIATLGILSLYDEKPGEGRSANWGLLRSDGTRKPSFSAFARG